MFQPYELLPHVPALLAKTSFTRSSLAHVFGFHCFYHCCLRTEAYRFRSYAFIGTNPFHVGLETFRGAIHFTIAVLPIPGTNFPHRVVEKNELSEDLWVEHHKKTRCRSVYRSIHRKPLVHQIARKKCVCSPQTASTPLSLCRTKTAIITITITTRRFPRGARKRKPSR